MSSGPLSGISNGTNGSQSSIDQVNSEITAANNEKAVSHLNYLIHELPKGSPISIPPNAIVKEEQKNGYSQVKYMWNDGEYSYTSRWHTRTPNALEYQEDSWVVQRDKHGKGYGQDAHPAIHEVLIGPNQWVSFKEWRTAIQARRNGTATKQQKEMLDNGHWKDER